MQKHTGGHSKQYLLERLERENPDILERLHKGEFRSVRQAAIAAGIVKGRLLPTNGNYGPGREPLPDSEERVTTGVKLKSSILQLARQEAVRARMPLSVWIDKAIAAFADHTKQLPDGWGESRADKVRRALLGEAKRPKGSQNAL